MIWETQEDGSSVLLMSRVTTPDAASYICALDKRDEEMDDENQEIDNDLPLSELSKKRREKMRTQRQRVMKSIIHAIVCTFLASETSRFFISMMGFYSLPK